jgi:hypothetical protein
MTTCLYCLIAGLVGSALVLVLVWALARSAKMGDEMREESEMRDDTN